MVTSFEAIGEDVYRMEGTIEATLMFVEEYAGDPDPNRTMTLQGSFAIERLPKD